MRKKQQDEVQEGAAWMTTYADMVTLLFTFFVLMFAISAVDNEKFALFIGAIQPGGLSEEQFIQIREKYATEDDKLNENLPDIDDNPEEPQQPDHTVVTDPLEEDGDPLDDDEEIDNDLAELERLLGIYINENNLGHIITLIEGAGEGDGLLIRLPGDAMFESGRADVTPQMSEVGESLAKLLSDIYDEENPIRITVSGHTDNVPQNSAEYPDNWWLSAGRANNFMRLLRDSSSLPFGQFFAQYFGEYQPIGDNDTPEGRQMNRRVEVLISQPRRHRTPPEPAESAEAVEAAETPEPAESEGGA